MTFEQRDQGHRHLLFAPAAWPDAGFSLFDAGIRQHEALRPFGGGRNSTWLYRRSEGPDWVLRHYARGGLVGKLVRGRYTWLGLERTRAWRELRLLGWMREQALPVPRPIAAHVIRLGAVYEQHLLTERIGHNAEPLQAVLQTRPMGDAEWTALGQCLRRFHDAGVHHADLNTGNVLLDDLGRFHLLDFDRGQRATGHDFVPKVLARFLRSLHKQRDRLPGFHFTDADWPRLLDGHGR